MQIQEVCTLKYLCIISESSSFFVYYSTDVTVLFSHVIVYIFTVLYCAICSAVDPSADYDYILNRVGGDGETVTDALDGGGGEAGAGGGGSSGCGSGQEETPSSFRRNSPHRNNSIRRNAWMRSSLRRPPPIR